MSYQLVQPAKVSQNQEVRQVGIVEQGQHQQAQSLQSLHPLEQIQQNREKAEVIHENQLLREALSISTEQLRVSQDVFMGRANKFYWAVEANHKAIIEQVRVVQAENKEFLKVMQTQNQQFNQNLNAVLGTTRDKIVEAISQNANEALEHHDKAITKAIKKAVKQSRDMDFAFERMFKLDDWRKKVFWGGFIGWLVSA